MGNGLRRKGNGDKAGGSRGKEMKIKNVRKNKKNEKE